jgi:hypothetical protein
VNWAFVRREWGAVTFVATVVLGMVVVPLALYFANQGPGPVSIVPPNTVTSARQATSGRQATPAHVKASPSPSAKPTA